MEARFTKEEDEVTAAIDAGIGDKALVDEMLEIARRHANRPDARIVKLAAWIRENMTIRGQWTNCQSAWIGSPYRHATGFRRRARGNEPLG